MKRPLEVHYRGISHSEALDEHIQARVRRLDRLHPNVVGCRLYLERPHRHHESSKGWRAAIDITVPPRRKVAMTRLSVDDNLYKLLDELFEAAERRVRKLAERPRGRAKPELQPVE